MYLVKRLLTAKWLRVRSSILLTKIIPAKAVACGWFLTIFVIVILYPKSVIRTLECGFSLLFDDFCVFSASFVLLFVSIARYASRKEKRNLLENPSKIITNPNDRIGFIGFLYRIRNGDVVNATKCWQGFVCQHCVCVLNKECADIR